LAAIIWKMPELTPPAEITSNSFCSDSPLFGGGRHASAIEAAIVIASMLLISLSTWPWPGGPTWKMFSQKAASTGSHVEVLGSAPTMVFSRPSSASLGVRASGASM
jgi:hypothetical protein